MRVDARSPYEYAHPPTNSYSTHSNHQHNIEQFFLMSKEAIMFMVDAGAAMDEMCTESDSRLKVALGNVQDTLKDKVFNSQGHDIGFALFGDKEADQEGGNNLLLQPIGKPSIEIIRKILQLSETKLGNTKAGGDIFDAIEYMVHQFVHNTKKSVRRRGFLWTCGMGETWYDGERLTVLGNQLVRENIKLNVIPIDFMITYDIAENFIEGEAMHQTQESNCKLLMELKLQFQDNVQIFPPSLAQELYKKFRKREANPVALFKGFMEIAPGIQIEVESFKVTRRERLKSLQKYDINQPFNQHLSKEKEIRTEITYIVQGDETGAAVEHMVNAYQYGPHLVPIPAEVETHMKTYEERALKFLGFIAKEKAPAFCFMSETECVVPSLKANLQERKLYSAFVYSLVTLGKYAIARYIPRNSKKGVMPRMVILIPHRTLDSQKLYLVEVPTVEDVRDYPFNSLKVSTEEQRGVVREMVQKMMIYRKSGEEEIEELKQEHTYSPTKWYFYQTVFHRALSDDDQIPPVEERIKRAIQMENRIYEGTTHLQKFIKKCFKLQLRLLPKDKPKKNKALVWKDIIEANAEPELVTTDDESAMAKEAKGLDFGEKDEEEKMVFDPIRPIASFNRMLNNSKRDLVDQAIADMTSFIEDKAKAVKCEEELRIIVDCISNLRRGCVEQQEQGTFDSWFGLAQERLVERVLNKLKSEGIGFIEASRNRDLFRVQELHPVNSKQEDFSELD